MAKLPSIEKIKESLEKMDSSILSKAKIESLNKIYITNEELTEFKSEEKNTKWDKCETFLIELYNINFSKEKLKLWENLINFNEIFDLLNNQLNYYNLSCDEIKNNKIFNESLNYILTIGNIMNADSNSNGRADGFNLDLLTKLNDIKDNNGKSLLNFVVLSMKKKNLFDDEKFNDKNNIKLASENLNAEINNNLNSLKKNLNLIENYLNKIQNEKNDFFIKAKNLFEEFNKKFNKIENDFNLIIEKCHELIIYYGIDENDSKYKNIELFFKLILNYLNEIENLYKKEENEKVFKRKYEIGQKVDKNIGINIIEQLKKKMNNINNK